MRMAGTAGVGRDRRAVRLGVTKSDNGTVVEGRGPGFLMTAKGQGQGGGKGRDCSEN